jgi:hypothetical protein
MRTQQQPMFGPGWGPMTAPPRQHRVWPKVAREATIFGFLALAALVSGVLAAPRGWLAVLLGRAVIAMAGNHRGGRDLGRTVLEWVAVGGLAFIVATATVVQSESPAKQLKAKQPVTVQASQNDYLEQARKGWANVWEDVATGYSRWQKEQAKKKEAH